MEINPQELTDISVLIEQRDLDHAQYLAQEQLLLHPNSAPVHALMGDIAAARHDAREAIDWYELALRLEHNPQVAARLERQRTALGQQAEAEIDQLLQRPPDNRRRLRLAIIGGFVLVGLLVWVIASVVPWGRPTARRPQAPGMARPAMQAGGPQTPSAGPPLVTGPAGPAGVAGRPATAAMPRPAGASRPSAPTLDASGRPINITQSVDAPMSDRDRLLTQGLSGITWSSGEALGWRVQAAVDDFTGYALITVQIAPGMQSAELSNAVIDMAYRLAVATIQADKGILSLTVRVLAEVEVEEKEQTLMAFRANTTRDHLDYYLKRGMQPDRQTIWNHVFATTWWNPSVPTGSETTR